MVKRRDEEGGGVRKRGTWVAVKGEDHGEAPLTAGPVERSAEHMLMSEVYAIKRAERHDRALSRIGDRGCSTKDSQSFDLVKALRAPEVGLRQGRPAALFRGLRLPLGQSPENTQHFGGRIGPAAKVGLPRTEQFGAASPGHTGHDELLPGLES